MTPCEVMSASLGSTVARLVRAHILPTIYRRLQITRVITSYEFMQLEAISAR
jgi:hypothetical protein